MIEKPTSGNVGDIESHIDSIQNSAFVKAKYDRDIGDM
jgi:hypothetical protein